MEHKRFLTVACTFYPGDMEHPSWDVTPECYLDGISRIPWVFFKFCRSSNDWNLIQRAIVSFLGNEDRDKIERLSRIKMRREKKENRSGILAGLKEKLYVFDGRIATQLCMN